ncbi:MAG: MBOAT family O-acyltransferase [Candidatus Krumholzibacteriota bacterium]
MFFNSLHYVLFLPLVVAFYFLIPPRRRWVFLLAASYYFYMCWKMEYLVLILVSTAVDYVAGRKMGTTDDKGKRRKYLILSLFSNLGLLFAFKYFNFFNESTRAAFAYFDITYNIPYFDVLLPVGISFYTFQTLSYTIDVYRGHREPERHLGIFALYVAFFPQLVAGPIERSTNLLPQFHETKRFNYDQTVDGLKLILWGMFKKVVIADRVAVVANTVFNSPGDHNGIQFIIGTVFFAFQIYCDFSGYSDIAIGSARILGVKLMLNFNRPYFSKTIAEFWKRWHISLSSWFRDYLYISLGGNRVGIGRWYVNLFITFLVSGLWHGANWTFIIWGGLNGLYLVMEILIERPKRKVMGLLRMTESSWSFKYLSVGATFALTCLAWIFFRANTLSDAFYIVAHLGDGLGDFFGALLARDMAVIRGVVKSLGLSQKEMIIAVLSLILLESVHFMQRKESLRDFLSTKPVVLRWAVYYSLVGAILFFGAFNMSQQFIYFQF